MASQTRVLTHHVVMRNPARQDSKPQTFEPGDTLPAWAHDQLVALNHPVYVEPGPYAELCVAQWKHSKAAPSPAEKG